MSIQRQQIGADQYVRGHLVQLRYLGPDLLCYVDNTELNAFYETVPAAMAGAERYIDLMERNDG